MPARWAAARIECRALIAGVSFEVVQVQMSFEMNSIPTCTVTLAVGRNIRTLKPAKIHSNIDKVRVRSKFEVYMRVVPLGEQGKAPNDWGPMEGGNAGDGETRIFLGTVVGTGWQRSHNAAQFTVHAEHWLGDLNYSSSVSGSSHPGNPADFTYAAGFLSPNVADAGGGRLKWVPHVDIADKITIEGHLNKDLWEEVLKKWMTQVSEQDPIDDRLGADAVKNEAALAALARMKSENMGMNLEVQDDANALGTAVVWHLNKAIGVADINTTLWGKLVGEWATEYWFSVIPRVEDALVVPFTGGLRGQPWAKITAGDYAQCDLNAQLPHALRCVGISHPTTYAAGGNANPGQFQGSRRGLAGIYFTKREDPTGLVMLKDPPRWLLDADQGYRFAGESTGRGTPVAVPIQTPLTPRNIGPAKKPDQDAAKVQEDMKSILKELAHQWFVIEMLKGRIGELSGRLRFDIAPGSQVEVEGGADQAQVADGLGTKFYATVAKVTHMVNAEAARAGTSFTLAHIRTTAENSDDDTSVARPPLYKEGWRGNVLIEGFQVGK